MASRVLDKKLKKVLDMRTDTPALLESLDAISTLFSDAGGRGAVAASGGSGGGGGGGGGGSGGGSGDGEASAGGGGGGGIGHEYSTLDARRSLREDLERQVRASFLVRFICTKIRHLST